MKQRRHVIIKTVKLSKQAYRDLLRYISSSYLQKRLPYSFSLYRRWCLAASILGLFTGKGDFNSTCLFLSCLEQNHVPRIKIKEDEDAVRIFIYVVIKKYERTREYSPKEQS